MMGQLHKEIEAAGNMEGSKEGIKQVNYILRKFMELLSKDKGMHRSVSYFANELCYTPEAFLESHQAGMWQDSVGFD